MALITCPECGKQISDRASACPNCGIVITPAVQEPKCTECGTELPKGAAVCPSCGCPVENAAAQTAAYTAPPVQSVNPLYTAPSIQPAKPLLGSAAARINEDIKRRTANTNVFMFCASAFSIVVYLIAFFRYMNIITKIDDFTQYLKKLTGLSSLSEKIDQLLNTVTALKWLIICTLAFIIIFFICDIVRLASKQMMFFTEFILIISLAAGFSVPMGIVDSLSSIYFEIVNAYPNLIDININAEELLDIFIGNEFTYFSLACMAVHVILIFVFIPVATKVTSVKDYCQNCGKMIKREGIGGTCSGCGARKTVPGYSTVPSEIVNAYPYRGETLVGMSPVRTEHLTAVIFIDVAIFVLMIITAILCSVASGSRSALTICILSALAIDTVFTLISCRAGVREKIEVTPSYVKLRNPNNKGIKRINLQISQISDVLISQGGCLLICTYGMGIFFNNDISDLPRIAAALTTLTKKG